MLSEEKRAYLTAFQAAVVDQMEEELWNHDSKPKGVISHAAHAPTPLPVQLPGVDPAAEVVRLVNIERVKAKVAPLVARETVAVFAQRWALSMSTYGLSHGDFYKRATRAFPGRYAAENIGFGQSEPAAIVKAWMESSGHKHNMLNPLYRECGVGISDRYWCLDLIS